MCINQSCRTGSGSFAWNGPTCPQCGQRYVGYHTCEPCRGRHCDEHSASQRL